MYSTNGLSAFLSVRSNRPRPKAKRLEGGGGGGEHKSLAAFVIPTAHGRMKGKRRERLGGREAGRQRARKSVSQSSIIIIIREGSRPLSSDGSQPGWLELRGQETKLFSLPQRSVRQE